MGSSERVMDNSLLDQRHLEKKQKALAEEKKNNDFVTATCGVPGICMEDQLDVFTIQTCRQPLSMFTFFREHENMAVENAITVEAPVMPIGAYVLPTECEYCHAKSTRQCPHYCSRPKLYLQKKRPPFAKPNMSKWDDETDHAVDRSLLDDQDDEEHHHHDHHDDDDETPQMISTDSSNVTDEDDDGNDSQSSDSCETNSNSGHGWMGMWSGSD